MIIVCNDFENKAEESVLVNRVFPGRTDKSNLNKHLNRLQSSSDLSVLQMTHF